MSLATLLSSPLFQFRGNADPSRTVPMVPASMFSSPADMNWAIVVYSGVLIFSLIFYVLYGRKAYDGPVAYVRKLD